MRGAFTLYEEDTLQVVSKVREDDGEDIEIVLTMEATPEEVDEHIKSYFKELGQHDYPGFRKGKAPRKVLEESVGGHVAAYGQVAEHLINDLAFDAIDAYDVIYIKQPDFNVTEIPEAGKKFTFTVSGVIVPEIKLTSYDAVDIEMPPEEATDSEVEKHVQELRDFYYTYDDVADRAIEKGDAVTVELTLTKENGDPVLGFDDAERMIEIGGTSMPPEFSEALMGKNIGDVVEFDFENTNPDEYVFLGEGHVHAKATVKKIRIKVLPELNDEFAVRVGAENVEELYKSVRVTINYQKKQQLPHLLEDRVLEALTKRIEGELPQTYVDVMYDEVQGEFFKKLQDDKVSLEEFVTSRKMQSGDFKKAMTEQAQSRAAHDLALDAIFREHCDEVTDEDINEALKDADDPEAALKSWQESGHMADLRQAVRRAKATQWLMDTANVTEVEED